MSEEWCAAKILTLFREGTSAPARANARRKSDAKPSAPANWVNEIRSFSFTSTASCACAPEAVRLVANSRRARSRIDLDGLSITTGRWC